jgi:dipeptidyl aminopeptidase/acylaminoacyl peptidase
VADGQDAPALAAGQAARIADTPTVRKRTITVDDLWKFDRVGAIALSPDGAQAVCSVGTHSMEENTSESRLWLLSTFGGEPRPLTHCGDKDGQPAWSPDGSRIAFVAKRTQQGESDKTPQLYLIAPDGGEARRISRFAPGVEAFKWLPDGKRIAFIAWVWPNLKGTKAQTRRLKEFDARKTSGYVTSEAQYRFWDHQLPMGRVAHLHLLDVATGRVTDLFEGSTHELPRADPNASMFDVSPDGRHLVFTVDPQPEKRIDHCKALVELHLRSGKFETVVADVAWDFEAPRYSPDGTRIAFVAANLGAKHTMPGRLAMLERGDGKRRWTALSGDWDHAVGGPLRWSTDAGALYFGAEDRGRHHLYRYALDSRSASIAVQGGWVQQFDVAGDVIASVADSLMHPARVHAHRAGAAPLRLERFNDALLGELRLGTCEEIDVKGALGAPVQVWLTFPPGFSPKKKYPLLHSIHGGPHAAAGDTFHYRWNTQVFAAHGYVVAGVNYHGSSGFGHEFLDSITHRRGELELQDIEAATDALLKKPWADRDRVFASGGSYGGYLVAWMNGHVPLGRYRAYVCHAGCFDWTAMFSDDYYTGHAKEFGAWYWDDPALLRAQSPSTFAGAMATPTLVVHGALDYRVPDQQGLAYYNTLKAKGVDARLLWFPDENHWVTKPRNARLWHSEFFDWLKRSERRGKPSQ